MAETRLVFLRLHSFCTGSPQWTIFATFARRYRAEMLGFLERGALNRQGTNA